MKLDMIICAEREEYHSSSGSSSEGRPSDESQLLRLCVKCAREQGSNVPVLASLPACSSDK